MYPDLNTRSQGFFNLVPRPISVSGNRAAGCEARVKNSIHASSAAERQKRAMAYRKCASPVWEFFEPPTVTKVNGKDVKRVQYLLCTQQLADGGGTSNLMSHLQVIHLEKYKWEDTFCPPTTSTPSRSTSHEINVMSNCC